MDNEPVDKDTDGRDDETSVQTLDTVGLDGLDVDVDETVELSLTTLALHVVSQPEKVILKLYISHIHFPIYHLMFI